MKALVIGSNSFSGSNFVKYLLEIGYQVFGVSRSKELNKVFLPYKDSKNIKNFKFFQYNLNVSSNEIADLIKKNKIPYIINFSAQGEVGSSYKYLFDHYQTNLIGQIKLFEKIKKMDFIKSYVQISTPEVYGSIPKLKKESLEMNPSSPYASSKASFDLYLMTQYKTYNLPIKFVRSSNVYGPCQQLYRIIPKSMILISKNSKIPLHGGGISKKTFTYIDDVSNAEYLIMLHGLSGQVYHISSENMISIYDLVKKICVSMNKNISKFIKKTPERLGQDLFYNLSSIKIKKELGWTAKVDLDLGIMLSYKWIYDNFKFFKKTKLKL